jgi:hypothetical protein
MTPDQHIVVTADGTPTLFSKQFNEHYHSTHGARQESLHVFIQMGLASLPFTPNPIPILEVGGGTLLNAHLSQNWLIQNNRSAIYHIAEAYRIHTCPEPFEAFPPIGSNVHLESVLADHAPQRLLNDTAVVYNKNGSAS